MNYEIIQLEIRNYSKCENIWNMKKQSELAKQFYYELENGNRKTYIYTVDGEYIGEISLVYNINDSDYTIESKRAYVSRLIVKKEYRKQGIGKILVDHICKVANNEGYKELSIGVDLDNYPALKLYINSGFDKIIYIGSDEQGQFVKLLKEKL